METKYPLLCDTEHAALTYLRQINRICSLIIYFRFV